MIEKLRLRRMRRAVARGSALLDERNPGWYHRVNLGPLNMHHAKYCVLGQVYGSYYYGSLALRLSSRQDIRHGFNLFPLFRGAAPDYWRSLNSLWRAEVIRRRVGATTPVRENGHA